MGLADAWIVQNPANERNTGWSVFYLPPCRYADTTFQKLSSSSCQTPASKLRESVASTG
jgi:hypothetical protein